MEKEKQSDVDLAREKEKMDNFNLAALQRLDDKIVKIIGSAGHVALYTFHADKQEWERKEVEGSLFVAARSVPPYHQVVVLNRLNTDNFIEPVTSDLEMEVIQPYLLFRNKNEEITGVWFYKKVEQTKISEVIQGLLKNVANQEKSKGKASSSSPRPDRAVKSSTDNANPQKDNKDPEQNTNLKDNQGQQRRGGAVKKVAEEVSGTSTAAALRQSRDATGDRRQGQDPLAGQPKPQQPQQPPQQQPQPQPLPKPQVPQPQPQPQQPQQHLSPIQQLHSSLQQQYPFPPSPYAFPPPQQPGGPFPPHFSPYHHAPPQHNFPQFPFPVPLQQMMQPNQPGPHYPPPQQQPQQPPPQQPQQPPQPSPLPFLQPPPGLAPSPQGRGEPFAQQQPQPPQRLLSPEFLVQQLSRPPSTTTTTTTQPPSQTQKPPITKENIRELLASLVQDDRFITMVHTAYLQQLQKEGS